MNTDTINQQETTSQHDAGNDQRHQPPFGFGLERTALRRPFEDRMLARVAAGLGRYFGVDTTIVRIAFVVLTLIGGAGIPLYLAACC